MSVSIDPSAVRRAGSRRIGMGCLVGTFFFGLVMVLPFVATLVAIWPGVLKLTAPVVCEEGFGDTVIARDTYSVRPGETSTTFTMYCVNERGELSDEGAFGPAAIVFAVLAVAYVVLMLGLVVVLRMTSRRRRRRAPEAEVLVPGMVVTTMPADAVRSWPPTPGPPTSGPPTTGPPTSGPPPLFDRPEVPPPPG